MIITFSDSSWQDDRDMGRSTGSYTTFVQGGLLDYAVFFPDPILISSGKAEYNTYVVVCMSSLHNHNFNSNLRHMGTACTRENRTTSREVDIGGLL